MKRKAQPVDLLDILKTSILAVIKDEKATTEQRLRAMELGTKLVAIERKHGDADSSADFFDRK